MVFPPLTQEPILHVDLTPNDGLAIRILSAYRENCNCCWAEDANGSEVVNPMLVLMNENNKERAEILDNAISKLLEN